MKKYLTISAIIAASLIVLGLSLPLYDANAQANIRTPQIRIGSGVGTTTIGSIATSTFGAGIRASSTALTGNAQGNGPFLVIGDTATTTIYGNTATSTFAAGASFAGGGIFTSNGIAVTGGSLLITSTATSTLSGGIQLAGSANICLSTGTCLSSLTAITSLNGLTGTTQTFTAQGPLLIGSSGTVHTFTASSSPSFGELRASTTLAVATTTLGVEFTFGVHGNALIAGSTTVRGLLATSTIETLQLRVGGTATSTFVGGILSSGTGNFTTGLMLGGALNNTSAATSSFTGGITTAGLFSSNGLTITGGSVLNTSTATSTWSGGIQLAGSANICLASGTCLAPGGGGSLFTDGGATTYLTATGDNLGIGTTSVATEAGRITLGVQGNSLLAGTTTLGTLNATNTNIFLGNVKWGFPAATTTTGNTLQGKASTTIIINGSNDLILQPEGYDLLQIDAPTAATSSLGWPGLPNRRHYKVICYLRAPGVSSLPQLKINGSGSADYGHKDSIEHAGFTAANGDTQIDLESTGSTSDHFFTINIVNSIGSEGVKYLYWNGMRMTNGSTAPTEIRGVGIWNNTASPVSHIACRPSQGTTYGVGSYIMIYGSRE